MLFKILGIIKIIEYDIRVNHIKFPSLKLRVFFRYLRDKTIADKLMYIPKNDTQNYFFCGIKLVVETFEHLTYKQTNQNLV